MGGIGQSVWHRVRGGILLGTEEFVARIGPMLREVKPDLEIRRRERFADRRSLCELLGEVQDNRHLRDTRICEAAFRHGYTLTAIAEQLGVHPSTVSRIVKRARGRRDAQGKV